MATTSSTTTTTIENASDEGLLLSPSQERLLDAEEIEKVLDSVQRPTVRMHLEALVKKLRKESEALQRVEASKAKVVVEETTKVESEKDEATTEGSVPSNTSTTTTTSTQPHQPPAAKQSASSPQPTSVVGGGGGGSRLAKYVPIDRFAFDAGGYNAPFVTLYVDLPGVGSIPRDQITCEFQKDAFDLIVHNLRGQSYRLFKDCLEKDIDADKSKIIVKSDKIVVKLAKVKQGEYGGYEYWSKLTDDPKKKKNLKENPSAGIMDLMKQMYEEGDDNIRKVIGETMLKQQRGELGKTPPGLDDFGSGANDDF